MSQSSMPSWTPDPSFYPSPRLAAGAVPEKLAYVANFDPSRGRNEVIAVVDLDSKSFTWRRADPMGAISSGVLDIRRASACRVGAPASSDGLS
jgi:56kDa selenium binding protein (SBP56)